MAGNIMLPTPQEVCAKEWNKIVTNEVRSAMGAVLDGEFTAANYPAGFNYDLREQYYNADSLAALNSLVTGGGDMPAIGGVYSALYKRVIGNLEFGISSKDQATINQEQTAQAALTETIVNLYRSSGLDAEPQRYPTIMYIMKRIKEVSGASYMNVDMDEYPNLAQLCGKLSEYARLAVFTSKLQNTWAGARDRLEAIRDHIESPSDDNGGLRTGAGASDVNIGWERLPETEQLLAELKAEKKVSFTLTADSFSGSESSIHFESTVDVRVPFNWFFNLKAEHEHEYDFSEYAVDGSKMSVTMTFNGVTVLAAVPSPLSDDNKKGWFAEDILKDAAVKSGKDATGYMLHGSEFDPAALFGENGELRRMKTLVISQQPIISLHFEKFDSEGMQEAFTQATDVSFSFLGGLITGEHNNDYSFSDYHYNSESQTLDVSIVPAPIGSTGSAGKQTAFVLGGVVECFGRQ